MIHTLVGFGDSWIHGDEIEDPKNEPGTREARQYREQNCFLGQLGQQLGLEVDNRGLSGGSLLSTRWEFDRWYHNCRDPENHLVVIGLTEDSRMSWWTNDPRSPWMHNHLDHPKHTWHDFVRWHVAHVDSPEWRAYQYWETVNFFDSFCSKHNIPLFQFNVFPPTQKVWVDSLYNPEYNMRGDMQPEELAPGRHANLLGAKRLAKDFTSLIKDRIMNRC